MTKQNKTQIAPKAQTEHMKLVVKSSAYRMATAVKRQRGSRREVRGDGASD